MNAPLPFGDADHPCRFCGHPLGLHNSDEGCEVCACLATVGEARCQSEADFDKWLPFREGGVWLPFDARLAAYKAGARRNHAEADVDVLDILRGTSPIGPYDRERIAREIERLRKGED